MTSRERKIAAAALLLLLSQDEDFLESFEASSTRHIEAPPPSRHLPRRAPSKVTREAKRPVRLVAEEDEVDSLEVEVGEPMEKEIPRPSPASANSNVHPRPQIKDVTVTQRKRPHEECMELDNVVDLVDDDDDEEEEEVEEEEEEEEPEPLFIPKPRKKYKKSSQPIKEAEGSTSDGTAADQGKKKKRFWAQKLYLLRERPKDHPLSEGIPYLDPSDELRRLRMSEECFESLLEWVSPLIRKKSTLMRESISPRQRLVAVLRFLVTGQTMEALKFSTLLSPSVMNTVLPETCQAIIQVLTPKYMKFPQKKEDWLEIASGFSERCDFPNCGGSMNARHVAIFKGVGSKLHINHKGYASVILATLVDSNHRFLSAEVIDHERESDESAISSSEFFQKLAQDSLALPDNTETEAGLDFVFVAPNSFPIHHRVLSTFPVVELDVHAKITYNEKVSSIDRFSDNALGLLASRFGLFRSTINSRLWKIDLFVRACCALHNFLSVECKDEYISENTYDHKDGAGNMIFGEWRGHEDQEFNYSPLKTFLRKAPSKSNGNREHYVEYFCAKLVERNLNLLL